jgi:hypothetical protein
MNFPKFEKKNPKL